MIDVPPLVQTWCTRFALAYFNLRAAAFGGENPHHSENEMRQNDVTIPIAREEALAVGFGHGPKPLAVSNAGDR